MKLIKNKKDMDINNIHKIMVYMLLDITSGFYELYLTTERR